MCSWVEKVGERIELVKDAVRVRMEEAVGKRKELYDRKSCVREFSAGDLV